MPRYKFTWANLPAFLLRGLQRDLGLDGPDPTEALRETYGARPNDTFVADAWDSLRNHWLSKDSAALASVVEELWRPGPRDGYLAPANPDQQFDWLRGRKKTARLRQAVLVHFIRFGEEPVIIESRKPKAKSDRGHEQRTSIALPRPGGQTVSRLLPPPGIVVPGSPDRLREATPPHEPAPTSAPNSDSHLAAGNGWARGAALSQSELESRLWAAANALRGPVDPADYKAYIFPLLFYKRICDTWEEEHERAASDYDDLLDDEIEADYHRFVIPEGCHWEDVRRISENVGVALQRTLDRVQQANPDTLAGIFGDVAWGNNEKLPEPSLLALLDAFGSLDLSPSRVGNDVLGNAYEYLLKQFADASGQKAGEFFTPRAVVRLLARLLDPQPTDSVYDPACGSGGMLVEAANEVIEAGGTLAQMRFYGQEVNLTTAAIARMNLYLHDVEDSKILRGDTLRAPKFRDANGRLQRFDVVIANPPFSLKNWGADVWATDPWGRAACGVPPASTGDLAWVQHMVASMRPGSGRLGVVMPHGVLFRGGVEGRIRQCLIERDQLEAVIGLPANLFYSTTIRFRRAS